MGLSVHSLIALCLTGLLLSPVPLAAQQQPAQTPPVSEAPSPAAPRKIRILVLEGQNAKNSLRSKAAINPVVQVLDLLDQPVEGATVTFEVSPTGPGGMFGSAPVATTRTDYTGQATAVFTPNNTPGAFSIKVTATANGESAETRIQQSNDPNTPLALLPFPPKPWYKSGKVWTFILVGAGAGIATGVILGTRGSNSTITISPGPIVIGGPN